MRREWKPGDVAMVNIGPDREVQATFYDTGKERGWYRGEGTTDLHYFALESDLPARPLVVIDPEDRDQVERLMQVFADALGWGHHKMQRDTYAKHLQAALREFANPTPPKPDEPMGLGAVVVDANGRRFTRRCDCGAPRDWWPSNAIEGRDWAVAYEDIDVAKVLSEGVTP